MRSTTTIAPVTLELEGKEWELKLTTNAICELEATTQKPFGDLVSALQNEKSIRLADLRSLFHAGLRGGGAKVSLTRAGEMMDLVGVAGAVVLIGRAVEAAFPVETQNDGDDDEEGGRGMPGKPRSVS